MHKQVDDRFQLSNPAFDHTGRRIVLREKIQDVADYIRQSTPLSREQSLALTKLEEAQMWIDKANERSE